MSVLRAAGWSVLSSLVQPLVAVPAFLFVAFFDGLVPAGLGFAGGAMLWMVVAEIVPAALDVTSGRTGRDHARCVGARDARHRAVAPDLISARRVDAHLRGRAKGLRPRRRKPRSGQPHAASARGDAAC
jgi:hypothetical protein